MTTREKVKSLENKLEVDALKVNAFGNTFQIYPWLKGRLFHKIITGKETLQKRNVKLVLNQIRSVFYGLHNVFRKYDAWAFTTSLERRQIGGKYHDKLFDTIGNDFGLKTLVIELRLFNYYPYRKIASKYAISRSFFMLFEVIYSKLFLRSVKVNNTKLLDEINDYAPGGVNHQLIIRKYLAQYKMMRFWLKIMKKPKVVFISVSYTNFGYIRAFKEQGIKVVELQHGLMTKNHHAYNYSKDFDPIQFPDYILTVGEKEVAVFDKENKFPVEKVVPIGSMIIDYYYGLKEEKQDAKKTILFALQDGQMGVALLEFILQLEEKIGTKYELLVQPRRTSKTNYCIDVPAVEKLKFSEKDFYSSVIEANIHCTVYSTTAVEALSLGVPNILVNIENQSVEQLRTILEDNPYTKFISTVEEFISVLPGLEGHSEELIQKSNEENIKSGYKENVKRFLEEILE